MRSQNTWEANTGTGVDAIALTVCLRQRIITGRDKIDPYHSLSQLSAIVLGAAPRTSYSVRHLKYASPSSHPLFWSRGHKRKWPETSRASNKKKLESGTNVPGITSRIDRPVGGSESRQDLDKTFPRRTAETPVSLSRWAEEILFARRSVRLDVSTYESFHYHALPCPHIFDPAY